MTVFINVPFPTLKNSGVKDDSKQYFVVQMCGFVEI